MWHYAVAGRRLVAPDLSPQVVRYAYVRFGVYGGLYLLAIILAFVDPVLTIGVWVLVGLLGVASPPFFRLLAWLEDSLASGGDSSGALDPASASQSLGRPVFRHPPLRRFMPPWR